MNARAESSNPLAPTTFLKIRLFRIDNLQVSEAKKLPPCVVTCVVTPNLRRGRPCSDPGGVTKAFLKDPVPKTSARVVSKKGEGFGCCQRSVSIVRQPVSEDVRSLGTPTPDQ